MQELLKSLRSIVEGALAGLLVLWAITHSMVEFVLAGLLVLFAMIHWQRINTFVTPACHAAAAITHTRFYLQTIPSQGVALLRATNDRLSLVLVAGVFIATILQHSLLGPYLAVPILFLLVVGCLIRLLEYQVDSLKRHRSQMTPYGIPDK